MKTIFLRTLYPALLLILLLAACEHQASGQYQGYVEGEYLQIASPLGGDLESLHVARGDTVASGAPLFTLEHAREAAAVAEAEQGQARAASLLADLTKGRRPTEIKAIEARLEQARAAHELARKEYDRLAKLVKEQSISRDAYDKADSELQRTAAVIDQLTAELETAGLGARSDAINAARAELKASHERLKQARWQLDQKHRNAPAAALVFDTYYDPGEFVPAGYPVVSLLPPGKVKLRFFVPETLVGTLKIGQAISYTFDGARGYRTATITFISPQAEYTPPVIYSRETREKLVFMLEAAPAPFDAANLHPGQPVDVRLEPAA